MIRTLAGSSVVLALLVCAPLAAKESVLSRDSGEMADKWSRAGTGHVIALETPKGDWWVRAVRIYGSRYGGGYDPEKTLFGVTICDERLRPLGAARAPYSRFAFGKYDWVEIPLAEPVRVPKRFKVVAAFDPQATRGVYVAYAEGGGTHSGYGLPGGSERPFERDKNWMIPRS